jgi:hypothetical protein
MATPEPKTPTLVEMWEEFKSAVLVPTSDAPNDMCPCCTEDFMEEHRRSFFYGIIWRASQKADPEMVSDWIEDKLDFLIESNSFGQINSIMSGAEAVDLWMDEVLDIDVQIGEFLTSIDPTWEERYSVAQIKEMILFSSSDLRVDLPASEPSVPRWLQ